ncbi:MAG: transglutaminase domain-containing protein [Oscillospiraceae bacterium]|nr:transglutaminase domain-containing protein [Oscillospiraceae bacterium]MBR2423092.1 transglutaminase domain-containing protein [Oscillospiraceae bacterium]
MNQVKKQGMRLRWPENPHKKNKAWLLQTVVSMLACTVLVLTGSELIGFGGSATMIVMAAIGIYLCLMYGLLLRSGKSLWFFYGTLMVLLLLVLLFRERVLEGYRLFWNQMSDAKVLGTGWVLPEWELQLPSEKSGICLTVFNILLSGVLTLLVCFLTSFAPPVLAALLPGAALVGMSVFGAELSFGWLLAILATSVLILLSGGWGSRNALASVTMSWVVSGAVATALILLVSLSGISNWSTQVGEQIQEAIHKHKFETEHTTLPEGDFRKYEEVEKGAEVALIVTMETPEDMYLRGFTGEVFEENQWKPLEKDLLVKNKNLLYWLNLNAFNPNAQFQAAAGELGLPTNTVTVQNMGACSLYRYVPFSLCGGEALAPENLNTEGVLSEGERVYTYSAVSGGSEAITQVLQHLQQSNEKMLLQYRKAESGYRHFVYNFYLQVPEDAKQLLAESWNDTAAAYGSIERLNYQQAQECALRFLSEIFPENGTPEETELPLDIARGSSYQYATVAVLTLRYFGIPARYAEGYLITEQMASTVDPFETLTVDSSCARAWVEVYQDGIGWIPMDLTPGLGEMIQENPDDSSGKGDGDTENPELDPEEVEDEKPEDSETEVSDPDGGSVVRILLNLLSNLAKVLGILALLFLILFLRRKGINRKKERRFQDKDPKAAVAWIFADSVNILEKLGLDPGNGSMRQLLEPAEERFGAEYAEKLSEMICLNDRAMFSSRPMEETHRESQLAFRIMTIQNITTQEKWYRQLWLKWVKCLY